MKNGLLISSVVLACLAAGCGSYAITADNLVSQLSKSQKIEEVTHWTPIGSSKYPSNSMERILCTNSKGEALYLYPDKNTTIKITSKSSNRTFKAYFDTVILKEGTLYGLRSRIVGGLQSIAVADIDKIQLKAEMPKTKKPEEIKSDSSGLGH